MLYGNEKLNIDIVKQELKPIFDDYKVSDAKLFGSVAKGNNCVDSDVDIIINTDLRGFKFLGLVESIRETLNKKVDVFSTYQIIKGSKIDNEINETGILIYG